MGGEGVREGGSERVREEKARERGKGGSWPHHSPGTSCRISADHQAAQDNNAHTSLHAPTTLPLPHTVQSISGIMQTIMHFSNSHMYSWSYQSESYSVYVHVRVRRLL